MGREMIIQKLLKKIFNFYLINNALFNWVICAVLFQIAKNEGKIE